MLDVSNHGDCVQRDTYGKPADEAHKHLTDGPRERERVLGNCIRPAQTAHQRTPRAPAPLQVNALFQPAKVNDGKVGVLLEHAADGKTLSSLLWRKVIVQLHVEHTRQQVDAQLTVRNDLTIHANPRHLACSRVE